MPPLPYQSPAGAAPTSRSKRAGLLIGLLGFLLGTVPVWYILYVLGGLWWTIDSLSPKPHSVELRGLSRVSFGATGVGLLACCPLALYCGGVAGGMGSRTGAVLSKLASLSFLAPVPLAAAGAAVICWIAGAGCQT